MLDYKDIFTKHYALGMSGTKIADSLKVSRSGANDFLRAFKACPTLDYPLPEGITNYGIASAVYRNFTALVGRDFSYEMPDYKTVEKEMSSRKNMPLVVLWRMLWVFWKRVSSLMWRKWTISVWDSSTVTCGSIWMTSIMSLSRRKPTVGGITGMRNAGNLCRCLRHLTNVWNGGRRRCPLT